MPKFAVHNGVCVLNVIVADSQTVAEEVTGLNAVETEGEPWIGWTLHGDEWRPPMPPDGVWEWDATAHAWVEIVTADSGE